MDGGRFDQFARALAAPRSRRRVLGRAAVATAAALGLFRGTSRAAADKQPICHFTGDPANPYVVIEIADPAWPAHQAHGDTPYVDCCVDADCGGLGACCNGTCVDTSSTCNCGGCGQVCEGVCTDYDPAAGGYTGVYQCQPAIPCPNHCSGHGWCDFSNGQCACDAGYIDHDCGVEMSCWNGGFFCNGHGVCVGNVCQCDLGFLGHFCDQVDCESVPCGDAASFCHCGACGNVCAWDEFCGDVGGGAYACQPVVSCPNDCSLHGACDQHTGQCSCAVGYTGPDCSMVRSSEEYFIPCWNGGYYCNGHGRCIADGDRGYCQCDPGWESPFCEWPVCA